MSDAQVGAVDPQVMQQIRRSIAANPSRELGQDWLTLGWVNHIEYQADWVRLKVTVPYPSGEHQHIAQQIENDLGPQPNIAGVDIALNLQVHGARKSAKSHSKPIKHIIAISSGKGGVGKSTVSANLAVMLANMGAKVGLLDGDIYGPSMPKMMGLEGHKPQQGDKQQLLPAMAHGVVVQSLGFLVSPMEAAAWRGPMAGKAFLQLFNETQWPELDYLLVDLPPGTGDVQLSLSASVPISGAAVVTTPQNIATLDAQKGINLFTKVNVPVLGVIENMSQFVCSECGTSHAIFGEGGAKALCQQHKLKLLGELPLLATIREDADNGVPSVCQQTSSAYSFYQHTASQLVLENFKQHQSLVTFLS